MDDEVARNAVLAAIQASIEPDEELRWVGICRTGFHPAVPGERERRFWLVALFPSAGITIASALSGQTWTAVAGVAATVLVLQRVVHAFRMAWHESRTMVYAVTSERVIARNAGSFWFEAPVVGLPVSYEQAGNFTNVAFSLPRPISVNGTRLRFHDGEGFVSVVDAAAMLRAVSEAGSATPVLVNRPLGRRRSSY